MKEIIEQDWIDPVTNDMVDLDKEVEELAETLAVEIEEYLLVHDAFEKYYHEEWLPKHRADEAVLVS